VVRVEGVLSVPTESTVVHEHQFNIMRRFKASRALGSTAAILEKIKTKRRSYFLSAYLDLISLSSSMLTLRPLI
jgi:hypothetical protein